MTVETIAFHDASYPEITYCKIDFPVVVLDGRPWWSTAHVQHFLHDRFDPEACGCFTSQHVGGHRFPFDAPDGMSHVVSSLAALEIAGRHPGRRANRMLAGWLRKRDAALRAAPVTPAGTLFRVDEAGPHPGRPWEDGLLSEWTHWSEEFQRQFQRPAPRTALYV